MAVRKAKKVKRVEESEVFEAPVAEVKTEPVAKVKGGFWMNVGWVLLLVGGLAHMLPEQMAPVLAWTAYGVSVRMAVGAVSVVVALYYLLGE